MVFSSAQNSHQKHFKWTQFQSLDRAGCDPVRKTSLGCWGRMFLLRWPDQSSTAGPRCQSATKHKTLNLLQVMRNIDEKGFDPDIPHWLITQIFSAHQYWEDEGTQETLSVSLWWSLAAEQQTKASTLTCYSTCLFSCWQFGCHK